ncbi:MAG: TSUP family transporter [Nitrososphaerota archaeon]
MITIEQVIIILLLSIITIVYTSAGFSGGSAFVAMLLLLGLKPFEASFYGLLFNAASAAASLLRWRMHLERSMAWYVVGAVPLAFLGGQLRISDYWLRIIITSAIIISGIFIVLTNVRPRRIKESMKVLVGAIIGLLAGITGIGGGIYLSPFLFFSGEASPKQIAATTTVFILLNSSSGLLGKVLASNSPTNLNMLILLMLPFIIFGASIGSFLGSKRLRQDMVKRLMGMLLIVIGVLILVLGT